MLRVDPADTPPPLAVTSLSLTRPRGDEPLSAVVTFRERFDPPGRWRLVVAVGDPGGESSQSVLEAGTDGRLVGSAWRIGGGAPGGRDGGRGQSLGVVEGAFSGSRAVLEIPASAPEDGSVVWVEVSSDSGRVVLPPVEWRTMLGRGVPGRIETAAVGVDRQGVLHRIAGVSTLEVVDGNAVASFGPMPTEVGGTPVASVIEVLRVGPPREDGGSSPFFVTFERPGGRITLWDARRFPPVAVETEVERWLRQGGGATGAELEIDLAGVAAVGGFAGASGRIEVGVERRVQLVDSSVVVFASPSAPPAWFAHDGSTGAEAVGRVRGAETARESPPAESAGGDGVAWGRVALVVAVALGGLASTALLLRVFSLSDGGVSSGVPPDEALAALERTVREVAKRIEDRQADSGGAVDRRS